MFEQDIEVLAQVANIQTDKEQHKIILFNDDVNTFDHVIDTLVKVCQHNPLQAEQCALLVHYKGKCEVKSGSYKDLLSRCHLLLDAGLTAEVQ